MATAGLDRGLAPKPTFGGHAGRKPRQDGHTPGSPEALAADRAKEAARKRAYRAAKRSAEPPPPLPASETPISATPAASSDTPFPSPGDVGGPVADPVLEWTPADFRDTAPELVELAEAWRVDTHTKRAVAGRLPRRVVEEISKDAAFPAGSKRSLSTSSPVTLARMFNALKVPINFKPIITMAPALVYIAVRDLMTGLRIEKMIADEQERNRTPPAAPTPKDPAPV